MKLDSKFYEIIKYKLSKSSEHGLGITAFTSEGIRYLDNFV